MLVGAPHKSIAVVAKAVGAKLIVAGVHRSSSKISTFFLGSTAAARFVTGVNTVFVTGLATDFCVAWTAMDARKLGFTAYVVEDATRAIDLNGSLAAAWKQMTEAGVKRIQSSGIA